MWVELISLMYCSDVMYLNVSRDMATCVKRFRDCIYFEKSIGYKEAILDSINFMIIINHSLLLLTALLNYKRKCQLKK